MRHSMLWKKLEEQGFRELDIFRFYESQFLHLLIPRETLTSWANVWSWFSCLAFLLGILTALLLLCIFNPLHLPWKWKLLSRVRLFATPWTIQSMEFSRPEYWSGQSFPSPGDLPNPWIKPRSPTLQADSLPSEPPGKPKFQEYRIKSQSTGI